MNRISFLNRGYAFKGLLMKSNKTTYPDPGIKIDKIALLASLFSNNILGNVNSHVYLVKHGG